MQDRTVLAGIVISVNAISLPGFSFVTGGLHLRIGFFTKFSEPVIIRLFFYTIVGKPLLDGNTFRSFLTLDGDSQPVCTANVVGCLIHDSMSIKKDYAVLP